MINDNEKYSSIADIEFGISNDYSKVKSSSEKISTTSFKPKLLRSPSDPITRSEILEVHHNSNKFQNLFKYNEISSKINIKNICHSLRLSSNKIVITEYCWICLENQPVSKMQHATDCLEKHLFCETCLKSWCTSQIIDGVIHIKCPYSNCKCYFTNNNVCSLVDESIYQKYQRFQTLKLNPNYRECSLCFEIDSTGSIEKPWMICKKCNHQYCYVHDNAHPNHSCSEYLNNLNIQIRNEIKASDQLIHRITKFCPECKAPTEKNGGCNHM